VDTWDTYIYACDFTSSYTSIYILHPPVSTPTALTSGNSFLLTSGGTVESLVVFLLGIATVLLKKFSAIF
jgi:hypothetical protein